MEEIDNKIARRIQALIAQAEGTDNPDEAQTFFEKAQELMLQYSIDEAMLSAARPAAQRLKPTLLKGVIVCGKGSPLEYQMRQLLMTLATNLGVRPIFHGTFKHERVQHITATVVGYESDLRLFEMMFTALHLDLSGQLEPKPDVAKSFDENVYILHAAAVTWRNIVFAMRRATNEANSGSISDSAPHTGRTKWPELKVGTEEEIRASGQRCKTAYRRYCKAIGEQPVKIQSPVTYQRNFAEGYVTRISTRLWEMRKKAEKSAQPGTALALRTEDVDKAFEEFFPDAKLGKAQRLRYLGEARGAGRAAGDRADLHVNRATGGRRPALD